MTARLKSCISSDGAAALARGYNVLAFDGPGQAALLQQGIVLRPDWEDVVTPVLDYPRSRPEVDPAKVALIGLSLGGYLAPGRPAPSTGSPRASPTADPMTCSSPRWSGYPDRSPAA